MLTTSLISSNVTGLSVELELVMIVIYVNVISYRNHFLLPNEYSLNY